mgnify:CR=1 FL=1
MNPKCDTCSEIRQYAVICVSCEIEKGKLMAFLKKQSEALAGVLEDLLKFNEELCEEIHISKHYPSADKARKVLKTNQKEDLNECN